MQGFDVAQDEQRWTLDVACQRRMWCGLPDTGLGTSTGQGVGQREKGQAAPASRSTLTFPGSREVQWLQITVMGGQLANASSQHQPEAASAKE